MWAGKTRKNNVYVLIDSEHSDIPYGCTTSVVYPKILALLKKK
jgi:hypothetical protein